MTPLFSIFLFYFLLFIYGEFSKYLEVRYASRMLLYGMTGNLVAITYIPDPTYAMIVASVTLLTTILYLIKTASFKWVKRAMILPFCLVLLNYFIAYAQPADLLAVIPNFYLEYSHKIVRESFLVMLGVISYLHGSKDERLNYTALFLYVAEYSITLER
ncbi:hypothetical protein VPHF99_0293 [Vibrio phage F99]|nr:membrane protein [Vibrio phage 355E48.1]